MFYQKERMIFKQIVDIIEENATKKQNKPRQRGISGAREREKRGKQSIVMKNTKP